MRVNCVVGKKDNFAATGQEPSEMAGKKAHIFVVDDDPCILEAACAMLESVRYECSCFADVTSCLAQLTPRSCELLITDVKMPGRDGMDLLAAAKKIAPWLPVVVMTSYADIPMSVKAVKAGAFDFVEKPLVVDSFLGLVEAALKVNDMNGHMVGKSLTKTEKIVLRLILRGMSNKGIAYTLGRSERTIEVHRSHIMHKLNVDNVVDLVKRATSMGLDAEE